MPGSVDGRMCWSSPDKKGRILLQFDELVDREKCKAANLFEGASWHERDIGCNGIGTCLEIGYPVVLVGPEHFQNAYLGWTCIGVPLRNAKGTVIGAIDYSVPNEHVETKTWGTILDLTRQIEGELKGTPVDPLNDAEGDDTLGSIMGVIALLLPQLKLPPTHFAFIEEARRATIHALRERTRAMKELHANEERYRLLKQATNDVIWDWNTVTGELVWNSGLETTFGYFLDELPNRIEWWKEKIHPDDRHRVSESIEAALKDPERDTWTAEYRFCHADKTWITVLDRGVVSRNSDGRAERMIGSMIDLTERARREEDLHLAVQRFETIANMMPQIVWSTRPDGYHDYFNERWYDYTGMPRTEGQGWNWKDYLHPDDVPQALKIWHHSLTTGEPYEVQYRFRRARDGAYRWFIGRAMPIYDREGTITRWFGTCTDIDDQRREEAKLEALVTERTSKLQEQTRRLRHLAVELATAEQRERRRLATLLHDDLQQVLVAARMQMSMLEQRLSGDEVAGLTEKAKRWVDEAVNTARNLSRELRPPALYEGGLAVALGWLAARMEERHHLKVELDIPEEMSPIDDDIKALLFDTVRELLFNATKYARVDVATVALRETEEQLTVTVSDRGSGFDPETAMRGDANPGYGLFSIRERLAALGGDFSLSSTPGEGTTVHLKVPRKTGSFPVPERPASPGVERRRSEGNGTSGRPRVLVVDDHAVVREGIAAVLSGDDRLVVAGQASNGEEALEWLEQEAIDVVLMDLNMPVMNGIDSTREIAHRWPETSVVGLSVQDDDATAQAMVDAGAALFLPKTGSSERMISAIVNLNADAADLRQ